MTELGNAAGAKTEPNEIFEALQVAHTELKQKIGEANSDPASADDVRKFIARVYASGALLRDPKQRKVAQSIIDFWCAELVNFPEVTAKDFVPILLAKFENSQSSRPREQTGASGKGAMDNDRKIIRLTAAARLWRDSGKKRGYLLTGETIQEAAKFRDADPDIAALVEASTERQRTVIITAGVTALVTVALGFFAFFVMLPKISLWASNALIDEGSSPIEKEKALRLLSHIQPLLPPLKSTFWITRANLKDLDGGSDVTLLGPNFIGSNFENTKLQGAYIPNAAFHDSPIFRSKFDGANLKFSQFERATISASSFVKARLYRASFDDAQLCQVDFSGADLRQTTFRNSTFGADFPRGFQDTAWWLALGWNSKQIAALVTLGNNGIEQTSTYIDEIDTAVKSIRNAKVGSYERALGLNTLAWTLATYGVIRDGAVAGPNVEPFNQGDNCMEAGGIPHAAELAARQAVCIIENLNTPVSEKYKSVEANFKDTLAYILLQKPIQHEELTRVVKYLEDAALTTNSKDTLFRAAIAQYAVGDKDRAIEKLKRAMDAERYVPTHELKRLASYIDGDLRYQIYTRLDSRGPAVVREASCPPM